MNDLLKGLLTKRAGVTVVLGLAAAAVGGGVVPHDGPEGQAAGAAAGVVVVLGLGALVKVILERLKPPAPPAPPGVAA